jgi:hypothetical protein
VQKSKQQVLMEEKLHVLTGRWATAVAENKVRTVRAGGAVDVLYCALAFVVVVCIVDYWKMIDEFAIGLRF